MQAQPLSCSAARNLNSPFPRTVRLPVADGPGLAHDARNLLGALGLYCDLLDLPGVLLPEHAHYARELRLLSQRSGVLIDRLMEGPRPAPKPQAPKAQVGSDAGTVPSVASTVPFVASTAPTTAASAVRAFRPLLQSLAAPRTTVSMAVASGLPELPFAAEVLERILVNLTCNAAAAAQRHNPTDATGNPTASRIHIGVCGGSAYFRLTVLDNGPGMPASVAEAFLNPAPLPPGTQPSPQRGLGHRVVHDLVQSTGGALSIDVTPHCGTTLKIDWPINVLDGAASDVAGSPTISTVSTIPTVSTVSTIHAAKRLSPRKAGQVSQAHHVPQVPPPVPQGVPISC